MLARIRTAYYFCFIHSHPLTIRSLPPLLPSLTLRQLKSYDRQTCEITPLWFRSSSRITSQTNSFQNTTCAEIFQNSFAIEYSLPL